MIVASPAAIYVKYIDKSILPDSVRIQSFILMAISAILFFGVYLVAMLITKDSLATEIMGNIVSKVLKKKKK